MKGVLYHNVSLTRCRPTFEYPPICQASHQHCNYTQRGGCCPLGTTCAAEGCTDVIEFVFPVPGTSFASAAATTPQRAASCEVDGCGDAPELLSHGLLPTSSTMSDPAAVAAGTGMWKPATWTVTVTGSKTGEVCDQSATATAGFRSGAVRLLSGSGWPADGSPMSAVLVAGFLVLAVGVLL